MGYEEEAKELMKRFKIQHEQNKTINFDLNKIYKESENKSILSRGPVETHNNISSITQLYDSGPIDQSPPDQSISNFPNKNINNYSTDQSPPDQNISMINNLPKPTYPTTPSSLNVSTGGNVCPQCKTIHPPLKPGEICPNAPQDVSKFGLDDTSVNKFIVNIKNIVMSQLSKKGISNGEKFFQFAIIELMKILEGYNEK
jgi:hypothetical protein